MEFIIFVMGCTCIFLGYLAGMSKYRRQARKIKRQSERLVADAYANGHKDGWIKGATTMADKYAPTHDVLRTP